MTWQNSKCNLTRLVNFLLYPDERHAGCQQQQQQKKLVQWSRLYFYTRESRPTSSLLPKYFLAKIDLQITFSLKLQTLHQILAALPIKSYRISKGGGGYQIWNLVKLQTSRSFNCRICQFAQHKNISKISKVWPTKEILWFLPPVCQSRRAPFGHEVAWQMRPHCVCWQVEKQSVCYCTEVGLTAFLRLRDLTPRVTQPRKRLLANRCTDDCWGSECRGCRYTTNAMHCLSCVKSYKFVRMPRVETRSMVSK